MKQDEKGGKRSADGVGESQHAGRWSGRAYRRREQSAESEPGEGSSIADEVGLQATPAASPRASSVTHVTSSDFRLEKSRA
jgi:hypothetical protein